MKILGRICGLVYFLVLVSSALADVVTNNQEAVPKIDQERQAIVRRLDRIQLPEVQFNSLSLEEVVRQLNQVAKQYDPEKEGVVITIATNEMCSSLGDVDSTVVNIPQLSDVRLWDVLDAILLVANRPLKYHIQSDGVVFSAKAAIPQLYSRVFKVDPGIFNSNLVKRATLDSYPQPGSFSSIVVTSSSVTMALKRDLTGLGVNFESPPGKSIFYNDRVGRIYVRATEADLEIIEKAVFEYQKDGSAAVHIKARFVEVPKEMLAGFSQIQRLDRRVTNLASLGAMIGILNAENFKTVMRALEMGKGVNFLAEPETTTSSGRQTQMRATSIRNLDSNDTKLGAISGPAQIWPEPAHELVETGPILDVLPKVLSDNYTINLTLIPSLLQYVDSHATTNATVVRTKVGPKNVLPENSPRFPIGQRPIKLNIWDGQTAVIGVLPENNALGGKETSRQANQNSKELMIFVTATLVDSSGNRVRSDADHPPNGKSIPPQPLSEDGN